MSQDSNDQPPIDSKGKGVIISKGKNLQSPDSARKLPAISGNSSFVKRQGT
jgi:hypothetical protein